MSRILGSLRFKQIIFQKKTFTREEFLSDIDNLINYINSLNISDSPFIFLFAKNHYKTAIAFFSILKLNKICVLIDPDITNYELDEIKQITPPALEIQISKNSISFDYTKEIKINKNTNTSSQSILNNVCAILYTNAEDGYAKPAMITYSNLDSMIKACQELETFTEDRVICTLAPFHHLFGLVNGIIVPAHAPCSIYIYDIENILSLEQFALDVFKYKITNIYSSPLVYFLLSRISEPRKLLSSLISCTSGGIKLSKIINDLFHEKTGKVIKEGYGLTEASPVCSWYHKNSEIIFGAVGQALPCCSIKILTNSNKKCKVGQIGEICIDGSNVMKGYYKNTAATRQTIKNNLLYTGDLGMLDEKGFLYITGIKKNMFNIGGKNVYPKELERLMIASKLIKSVTLSSTYNEILGDNIKADIVLEDEKYENHFKKWCLENISNYKLPKKWCFSK